MRTLLLALTMILAVPCLAEPAGRPAGSTFKAGEMIYRKYESPKGAVEILADAHPNGTTLHLSDIAIYPVGTKKLELGMRDLLRLTGELKAEAHASGFSKLHITGKRLTGAKPGKKPDLWFDTAPGAR